MQLKGEAGHSFDVVCVSFNQGVICIFEKSQVNYP